MRKRPRPHAGALAEGKGKPQAELAADRPGNVNPPPVNPVFFMVLLGLLAVTLIGLAYTIPVQIALASPISGLIFGFALWEAWKINRGVRLSFNGPFRLTAVNREAAALDGEETLGEH